MRTIALLRGVNLGPRNRIAMADLRAGLELAGFSNVRTYVQSGNIVLDGDGDVEAAVRSIIDVPVITRSAAELEAVIAANPFEVPDPKRLQVTFRSEPAGPELLAALEAKLTGEERVAVHGREIYSWHPDGMARSKLALAVVPSKVVATARNWNTVLKLADMAATP
ncbi:MAG: DUF1697 domain-containing protein [Solirubrobacterales bacterium]|nr:DUF1697 domain-containing protein [Solirubrobacterales bacterium]